MDRIDPQPLDEATRRALAGVTTATLTTVLLKKGLRNVWVRGARPLADRLPERRVGRAFTLCFVPAREDRDPVSWGAPVRRAPRSRRCRRARSPSSTRWG
jgi:hypothetical protein